MHAITNPMRICKEVIISASFFRMRPATSARTPGSLSFIDEQLPCQEAGDASGAGIVGLREQRRSGEEQTISPPVMSRRLWCGEVTSDCGCRKAEMAA
mgnify:CR=1 FL=1